MRHRRPHGGSVRSLSRRAGQSTAGREKRRELLEEIPSVGHGVLVEIGVEIEVVGDEVEEVLRIKPARAVPLPSTDDEVQAGGPEVRV